MRIGATARRVLTEILGYTIPIPVISVFALVFSFISEESHRVELALFTAVVIGCFTMPAVKWLLVSLLWLAGVLNSKTEEGRNSVYGLCELIGILAGVMAVGLTMKVCLEL